MAPMTSSPLGGTPRQVGTNQIPKSASQQQLITGNRKMSGAELDSPVNLSGGLGISANMRLMRPP